MTPAHSKLNCSLLDLVRNLQTFNSSVKYNNMKGKTFLIFDGSDSNSMARSNFDGSQTVIVPIVYKRARRQNYHKKCSFD